MGNGEGAIAPSSLALSGALSASPDWLAALHRSARASLSLSKQKEPQNERSDKLNR